MQDSEVLFPPSEALRETDHWRARARAVRHDCWFALVAFGVITVSAAPFFWQGTPACPHACHVSTQAVISVPQSSGPLGNPLVYGFLESGIGRWISLYWMIALPVGFAATVLYYRQRARRTGMDGRIWPVAVVGLVLIALLVVFSTNFLVALHLQELVGWVPSFTFQSRGLGPLLVIAACVFVLAIVEHRPSLAAFATVFLACSVLANINIDKVPSGFTLSLPQSASALPNLVIPGILLVGGGVGFWLSDRRALRASGTGT